MNCLHCVVPCLQYTHLPRRRKGPVLMSLISSHACVCIFDIFLYVLCCSSPLLHSARPRIKISASVYLPILFRQNRWGWSYYELKVEDGLNEEETRVPKTTEATKANSDVQPKVLAPTIAGAFCSLYSRTSYFIAFPSTLTVPLLSFP